MTHYEVFFKGMGPGREGVQKAFLAAEGAEVRRRVVKVVDTTRIKIGGVRPKKRMGEYAASVFVKTLSSLLTIPTVCDPLSQSVKTFLPGCSIFHLG